MQKTTMSGPKRFLRRIQLRSYVFFHKSRKTPYFLYDSHIPSTESKGLKARIISFFAALSLLTVLAFIIPLRPTYSDHELRELAADLAVGSPTSGLFDDVWDHKYTHGLI